MAGRSDVVRFETAVHRGTGFLIDEGRVITALHVIGKVRAGKLILHGRAMKITAAVARGASLNLVDHVCTLEDVIEFDERLDWACIRVKDTFADVTPLPLGEIFESDQTAEWHTYGFPAGSPDDGKATTGTISSVNATLNLGGDRVSAIQLFSREAAAGLGGEVRGYSGGPVIVDGRVVGILTAAQMSEETRLSEEGTLYAVPWVSLRVSRPAIECPYPGLRPFGELDAKQKRFFGRDREIEEVLGRLRGNARQILIFGSSGSGKSSFIKAGVVPRLSELPCRFEVCGLQPGANPCESLRRALDEAAGASQEPTTLQEKVSAVLDSSGAERVLLIVDQLEELFTQCADTAEQQRFIDGYIELLSDKQRCTIISTIRADFFDDLIDSALWPHIDKHSYQLALAPLRGGQLRKAIEAPARAAGVRIEDGLRERLVADASSEPGALPLLQVTLRALWDKQKRNVLCLADYDAMGDGEKSGLAVQLGRMADAVLNDLTDAQQAIARRIFLRLVSFDEGRAATRRQQASRALMSPTDDEPMFRATVDALTKAQLLTCDSEEEDGSRIDKIDMAHEALIVAWPTFVEWIELRRVDEQRRRMFESRADEWNARGRGEVALLDAVQLAEVEAWVKSDAARDVGYGNDLTDFLDRSRRVLDEQNRQQRRRTYGAFIVLAVFSVVVSLLAIVALKGRRDAQREANVAKEQKAEARRLLGSSYMDQGRQLVVDGLPQQALPFLVAAREQGIESNTLKMLVASARPLERVRFVGHSDSVRDVAISPDGTRVVTGSNDKTARVWDAKMGRPITPPLVHGDMVRAVAFSPDGRRVATASMDKTARVWDATTGAPISPPLEHGQYVTAVMFSSDGTRVLTTSMDRTARVWDATTGAPITQPLGDRAERGETAVTPAARFSPDGTRVVTGSDARTGPGKARVWDATTGQPVTPLLEHLSTVHAVSFSPDGTRLVTAGHGSAARVWDAKTGAPIGSLSHRASIYAASFSPDGARIVTASADHTAGIWDAKTEYLLIPWLEHFDDVVAASFSPDGACVVTASEKMARVWDAKTGKPLTPWLEHQGTVNAASFSADGAFVVTASADRTARAWDTTFTSPLQHPGSVRNASFSANGARVVTVMGKAVRIWDTGTGKPVRPPIEHRYVLGAALSADGARVVIAGGDKTARVWNATSGEPMGPPLEHSDSVDFASFSSDGTRIVTASRDRTARVWNASTGEPLTPPLEHREGVNSASFSADGSRIVTASADRTARVWDATTGKPITPPLEHDREGTWSALKMASFSADGSRVVTASLEGTARVWDATTGVPVTPLMEHDSAVLAASFSADGTRVVTASADKTARVWDASTGKPITPPLRHRERVEAASFSPDGTRVVTASRDHTARVWDATTGRPLTPPLEHEDDVLAASFNVDGTRIVTASGHNARIWSFPMGQGSLEQWQELVRCSPYALSNGTLGPHSPPETCWAK